MQSCWWGLTVWLTLVLTIRPAEAIKTHTNNWAVLVGTSRFWYNYRHQANTLTFYHTIKQYGIPDSQIILMLADDAACNSRNPFPGTVYNSQARSLNLYGSDVEVDYRGSDVTVSNFLRVLSGRHDPDVPKSKRLDSDSSSNILLFMTGHGGDGFLKFQDSEELTDIDMGDAIAEMKAKGRFNEILYIVDTCHAASMLREIRSDGVLGISSATADENSYSYGRDNVVGLSMIDRFTYFTLEFFEKYGISSGATIEMWHNKLKNSPLISHPVLRTDSYSRDPAKVPVSDFFGAVIIPESSGSAYPLAPRAHPEPMQRRPIEPIYTNAAIRIPAQEDGPSDATSSSWLAAQESFLLLVGVLLTVGASLATPAKPAARPVTIKYS